MSDVVCRTGLHFHPHVCRESAVCTKAHCQGDIPGLAQSRSFKEMYLTVSLERRHPSSRVAAHRCRSRRYHTRLVQRPTWLPLYRTRLVQRPRWLPLYHTRLVQRPRWPPLSNIGVGSQLECTLARRLQPNRHV